METTVSRQASTAWAIACAAGATLVVLVCLLVPATASAEERVCRGALGAITVDNLRVPQGSSCSLTGTRVQGTVKVERAATLSARGIRVIGNVQYQLIEMSIGAEVNGKLIHESEHAATKGATRHQIDTSRPLNAGE